MTFYRSMGAALDTGGTGTNPLDVRKDWSGVLVREGVFPGGTVPLVTGTAGWAYSIGAGAWATSSASGDGLHVWGNDGAVTVGSTGVGTTVPAAPSAGLSRIDIIWVRHPSNGENADTSSAPVAGVAVGTAAASPVAPALPAGAFELARNTMTDAATTTASAGNTITQTAPFTATKGGAVQARSTTELVALAAHATTEYPARGRYAGGEYRVLSTGVVLPDTGATAFPYSANWGDNAAYGASVSFKDSDGWVRLSGVAMRTGVDVSAATATLGTLPAGHRPAAQIALPTSVVLNGSAATRDAILQIATTGVVTLQFVTAASLVQNTTYCTLSGSFPAA